MDSNAPVQKSNGTWSSPSRGFALEQELERLIQDYPEVLPGVSAAALAVDQFSVPSGGSVDLVVLEPDASITVVECKLAKDAEVRRAVVEQILSYAVSLTHLEVDEFLTRFEPRLGRDVVVALAPETGVGESENWDSDRFRGPRPKGVRTAEAETAAIGRGRGAGRRGTRGRLREAWDTR